MSQELTDTIWSQLRRLNDPRSHRDIVSLGIVENVESSQDVVSIQLARPDDDPYHIEALANAIRREVGELEGVGKVSVSWPKPEQRPGPNDPPSAQTIHLPVMDNGGTPDFHALDPSQPRAGIAPGAGYGEGGPEQLPSPELEIPEDRYEGWPPVYQWEIDPADPALVAGEEHARLGDWEYEIWWQEHSSDLLYASIQAVQDDSAIDGPERKSPMGRNVVVNVVYDRRREAVVAVYGTARDFRPFIEAFRIGCGLERMAQENDA